MNTFKTKILELTQILPFRSGLFHYHSLKPKLMSSQIKQVIDIKHMGNICSIKRFLNNLVTLGKRNKIHHSST